MSKSHPLTPSFNIHLDRIIDAFAVSDDELELLARGHDIFFKDLFNISISCGVPCAINAFCNYTQGLGDPIVFFNALFGTVGIILSITFFLLWKKEKKSVDDRVEKIKKGLQLILIIHKILNIKYNLVYTFIYI